MRRSAVTVPPVLTIVDYLNDAGYETLLVGFQHERHGRQSMRYSGFLDETGGSHRPTGADEQPSQERLLARRAKVEHLPIPKHLERSENSEFHVDQFSSKQAAVEASLIRC